jgi:hypothetical protein
LLAEGFLDLDGSQGGLIFVEALVAQNDVSGRHRSKIAIHIGS